LRSRENKAPRVTAVEAVSRCPHGAKLLIPDGHRRTSSPIDKNLANQNGSPPPSKTRIGIPILAESYPLGRESFRGDIFVLHFIEASRAVLLFTIPAPIRTVDLIARSTMGASRNSSPRSLGYLREDMTFTTMDLPKALEDPSRQ